MNHIEFSTAPATGSEVHLDEQVYELVAVEDWRRADGTASNLLTWQSECPRCGQPFAVTTGLIAKTVARRCPPCRKVARSPVSRKGKRRPIRIKVVLK